MKTGLCINASILLLLIMPAPEVFADASDSASQKIIGISKNLGTIAIKNEVVTVGPILGTIMIKDIKKNTIIKKFEYEVDPAASQEYSIPKEAKEYLDKNDMTMKYFNENFQEVQKKGKVFVRLSGTEWIELENALFGDIFYIVCYDKDNERVLYKKDQNLRTECKDINGSRDLTQAAKTAGIENSIRSLYQNKKNPYLLLACVYHRHNFPMGVTSYEDYIALDIHQDIKDPLWLNLCGYRFYKEKKYERALRKFKEAIKENPDYFVAIYNAACTCSLLHDESSAIKYLEQLNQKWKKEKNKEALDFLKNVKKDRDFDPVRHNKDLQKIISDVQ